MKIKKICWNCEKEFEVVSSQVCRKFCCKDCYKEYRITPEYKTYLKEKIKQGNKLYRL